MKIDRHVEVVKEFVGRKKIFSATFIKTNGDVRVMSCRLGVRKGVKGVGMKYNPEERELLTVYDMHKRGFRTVNISTLIKLKANKQEIIFQ